MNNFTKKLTVHNPECPKCNSKLNDTAAIFLNKEFTKIIETRGSCSNRCCDYIRVTKNE